MNDRPMACIIVGMAFAGFLYIFLNPAAVKSANQAANYRWIGFGKKLIWFFRVIGALGPSSAASCCCKSSCGNQTDPLPKFPIDCFTPLIHSS
jgi:hypothetical protein